MEEQKTTQKLKKGFKERVSVIRLRTWSLTLCLVITVIFYFLVNATLKDSLSIPDFCLLCFIQITAHFVYFPEGETFGKKNDIFIANRNAYNDNATNVLKMRATTDLRSYCDYEFEERKKEYVAETCASLNLDYNELSLFKEYSENDILALKEITIPDTETREKRTIYFTKKNRKMLAKLLFHKLPIERNNPNTIISAITKDNKSAISDTSVQFKNNSGVMATFKTLIICAVLSYIGYTLKNGINLVDIVRILMCLCSTFSTIIVAFSQGEDCTKIYKNDFYLELSTFIEFFFIWREEHTPPVKKVAEDVADVLENSTFQKNDVLVENILENEKKFQKYEDFEKIPSTNL